MAIYYIAHSWRSTLLSEWWSIILLALRTHFSLPLHQVSILLQFPPEGLTRLGFEHSLFTRVHLCSLGVWVLLARAPSLVLCGSLCCSYWGLGTPSSPLGLSSIYLLAVWIHSWECSLLTLSSSSFAHKRHVIQAMCSLNIGEILLLTPNSEKLSPNSEKLWLLSKHFCHHHPHIIILECLPLGEALYGVRSFGCDSR